MPRKQLDRIIEGYPCSWCFTPEDRSSDKEDVVLTLDEFESIRLIDHEGMTQEACAEKMGVGRTTVTSIYESARQKIARSLVEGRSLLISGGQYRILQKEEANSLVKKERETVRIAVTYDNGMIFQHFGRTEHFKLYDVKNEKIKSSMIESANGQGHGALADLLRRYQVDDLICGGIGMGARMALKEAGISLYRGLSGDADKAVLALLNGKLQYDPDEECDLDGCGAGSFCERRQR